MVEKNGKKCLDNSLIIHGVCPQPRLVVETYLKIDNYDSAKSIADKPDFITLAEAVFKGFKVFESYEWERNASLAIQTKYRGAIREKIVGMAKIQKEIFFKNNLLLPGIVGYVILKVICRIKFNPLI